MIIQFFSSLAHVLVAVQLLRFRIIFVSQLLLEPDFAAPVLVISRHLLVATLLVSSVVTLRPLLEPDFAAP